MEFAKEGVGEHGEALGTTTLYVDEVAVSRPDAGAGRRSSPSVGDGLCIGRDSADAVSKEYKAPDRFKGGTIHQVEINLADDQYLDLEHAAAAMMARE